VIYPFEGEVGKEGEDEVSCDNGEVEDNKFLEVAVVIKSRIAL
jgi:hypothetical protein